MDKAKNLIVLTIEILLVLGLIVFVTVYIWTSSTEDTYHKVISDIKIGNYENASKDIKSIPHYKDANDIAIYIYPISLFYKKYEDPEQEMNGYRMATTAINEVMPKLKNEKYRSDLVLLSKVLDFKIQRTGAERANIELENLLKEIKTSLAMGDIIGATDKIGQLNKPSMQKAKAELTAYVTFLNAENLDDQTGIEKAIEQLDPSYKGVMSDVIQKSVLKYVDSIKWNELYKVVPGDVVLSVARGMTKAETIALLGQPTSDTKVSGRYGAFEMAIFDQYGTVYFEGGKIVAYTEKE